MTGFTEVTGTLALPDLVVDLRDDGKGNAELLPVDRQDKALAVTVPRWRSVGAGNVIALRWEGEILEGVEGASHVVSEEEANPPDEPGPDFPLTLPPRYWDSVAEGEDKRFLLGYAVQQTGSDDWEVAENAFYVRIDRLAPGGSEGGLGKVMFPAELEERGYILESDFVSGLLNIRIGSYSERQLGDEITLGITDGVGSISEGPFKVESEAGSTEVSVSLAKLQGLFEGVPIRFTYQVKDLAGNVSAVSIAHELLTLRLTQTLPQPKVEGVNERDELDFNALGDGPVKVIIEPDPAWVGKKLQLVWVGLTANGASLPAVIEEIETLEAGDLEDDLLFELDNVHAVQVLQGSATLLYRISDTPWRSSPPYTVKVTGVFDLETPEIVEAPGQWLDPAALPAQGATVRIQPGQYIEVGNQIQLEWHGRDAADQAIERQWTLEVKQQGPIEHLVDKAEVEALQGGSLELSYTLTSNGGAVSPSPLPSRGWRVSNVLRRPEVEKAFGDDKDQLDFHRDFIDATHVKVNVARYPGMKENEQVSVRWVGEDDERGVWTRVVRWARKWILKRTDFAYQSPWKTVTEPAALVFEVPVGVVMAFIGKTVSVSYLVKPAGDGDEESSDVLALNVMPQDRVDLQAPRYMSFAHEEPKFSLRYDGVEGKDTVDIHWQAEGSDYRKATVEVYQDGQYFLILVDKSWAEADRRKTVFANYSFLVDPSKPETRQFSPTSSFRPD